MNSEAEQVDAGSWAVGLARFLQDNAEVEALRVDSEHRKVEIATLGPVDMDVLRASLAETIHLIESHVEPHAAVGVAIETEVGGGIRLQKPTCLTAPILWRWRELEWPEALEEEEATGEEWRVLGLLAGGCAVLGISGWMISYVEAAPAWVSVMLYIGAMIAGGWDAFEDTKEGLPKGELDIHFLMLAVAVGAASIGAWAEGALLLFLFSFSGALEHFALYRTRREINSLFDAAPKFAIIRDASGNERELPVAAVNVGDVVVVKPGAQFPVDAEVINGKSAADESNLTGEANPVPKLKGDTVFSGTINLWGADIASGGRKCVAESDPTDS
jgi:Cd2+/Zn2+-exporting ATPase